MEEEDVMIDTNSREIVLDILMEILEKGNLSHLVLKQALEKYQYLEKQDRAFITRITEGTLEYLIQIDSVINRYSKVKINKMKPVIRTLLRMSVYQILYIFAIIIGAALKLELVWNIADTVNGFMAVPNLIALLGLGGVVVKLTKDHISA